jgi:hypothetical protein
MTDLPVENVQDYPRPPAIEPVAERLRVDVRRRHDRRHHARLPHPRDPPRAQLLHSARRRPDVGAGPTSRETYCEWKGRAAYFDIVLDTRRSRNAAWAYPAPVARYGALKDHLSFYAGSVDAAHVGDIRVTPQPGDFYGGWVTPNLTGQIKGAAGTMHW